MKSEMFMHHPATASMGRPLQNTNIPSASHPMRNQKKPMNPRKFSFPLEKNKPVVIATPFTASEPKPQAHSHSQVNPSVSWKNFSIFHHLRCMDIYWTRSQKNREAFIKRLHQIVQSTPKKVFEMVDEEGRTPLHYALAHGDEKIMHAVGKKTPDKIWWIYDKQKQAPIHLLLLKKEGPLLYNLLTQSPQEVFVHSDPNGNTLLHLACLNKKPELVNFLICRTPAFVLESPNHFGQTPLHCACESGNFEIASLLIHNTPLSVLNRRTKTGETPKELAAELKIRNLIEAMELVKIAKERSLRNQPSKKFIRKLF
jgi:ankyrin repeat protein